MTKYRKKLIEVALPLEAINKESAREKSIRHGHPSTLHLWWARRPLAACRAVLFSSLVNDPEDDPMYGIDKEIAYTERAKLFDLIEELVKWENSNNPRVINAARLEIARSIAANKVADKELKDNTPLVANAPKLPEEQAKYLPDPPPEYTAHDVRFKMPGLQPEQVNHFLAHYAPPVLDPFAGGGSIPLEAQRLGLRAYASDLNPVPVLINKAMIEFPAKFAGMPPANPKANKGKLKSKVWNGAEGLAEDVRYYGQWIRDEAEKRIGHLYPKVQVIDEMAADRPDLEPYVGKDLTVIAWLWARMVECPNPACKAMMPLVSSFALSSRASHLAAIEPHVDRHAKRVTFSVSVGSNDPHPPTLSRSGAICICCEAAVPFEHVREKGRAGEIGQKLMAIVLEGPKGRVFVSPTEEQDSIARKVSMHTGVPETQLPNQGLGFRVQRYGLTRHSDLFTQRQAAALTTFADLVCEVRQSITKDASQCTSLIDATEYANAVSVYLAFATSKAADLASTLCNWQPNPQHLKIAPTFSRPTLSMKWDFAEGNPFSQSSGNFFRQFELVEKVLYQLNGDVVGVAEQRDARVAPNSGSKIVVSTDPPYYDNIGYADLSDFFYIWLRRMLSTVYPSLFATMLVPKQPELISDPSRHENRDAAKKFFEQGLKESFSWMRKNSSDDIPLTVYYAFKQTEQESGSNGTGVASTGWEVMLEALMDSDFIISGTWPVRTERSGRPRHNSSNALASSIVLVCRPRHADASMVTRRVFANALRQELPDAIKNLQSGNVAPVDLAQASIGPGMAVFSRYKQVVNADGSPMSVREALQMINQMLDESLSEQEADFDSETRFAVRWFDQYGMADGPFGDAETLAKAMAVAVSGVVEAGIIASKAGKVRLLKREELGADWNPKSDQRSTIWECTQHLIRRLETGGEPAAAELLAEIKQAKGSEAGEVARELSYRLYSTCERKHRATEAVSYNRLVVSWPEIVKLARGMKDRAAQPQQQEMF
jgi:putative DNA methylase